MIGYVTVGTNDMARASAFYDALFAPLGAKRVMDIGERLILWGVARGQPAFGVVAPYDKQPAHRGNGAMTALLAGSRENVDKLHALALQLGGTDEGAPGDRGYGFYGGYFRDLDGNKLNFFHMGS
jgi:catechol 2,3-dioxygenase-like lactoylglutathione lyase family enzyme